MSTPRIGSRPWQLVNLAPGNSLYFEVPEGQSVTKLMQQINTDILRNDLAGKMKQQHIIGVQPTSRCVIDLVRVTRIEE